MRELTKSLVRISWAMPLYGIQQALNMSMPTTGDRTWGKATDAFDAVSKAAREELDAPMKQLWDAGDRVQEGVVDLMFRFIPAQMMDPGNMMKMMMGGARGGCAPMSPKPSPSPSDSGGWGPMPPSQ